MQRAERRLAAKRSRAVRTLTEADYLLGVSDESRLGALRFRWADDPVFPQVRARPAEIERMSSAFEHDDLRLAKAR
jgi:serine/threonine-protein kinase HipA